MPPFFQPAPCVISDTMERHRIKRPYASERVSCDRSHPPLMFLSFRPFCPSPASPVHFSLALSPPPLKVVLSAFATPLSPPVHFSVLSILPSLVEVKRCRLTGLSRRTSFLLSLRPSSSAFTGDTRRQDFSPIVPCHSFSIVCFLHSNLESR